MNSDQRAAKKNKCWLEAVVLALFAAPCVYAFDVDPAGLSIHAGITREALGDTLSDVNLKAVVDANDSQNSSKPQGLDSRRHFDSTTIGTSLAYVDRQKKVALNCAAEADVDGHSRLEALRHFGLLVHSVQDFYSKSNYVELQLESPQNANDPYNIPLVDWSKLPDGYAGIKCSAASHEGAETGFAKDTPDCAEGKKPVTGKATYYSVARDLAVRETQRQWNLFEALIRSKCGERANAVITALKQTPPDLKSASSDPTEPSN